MASIQHAPEKRVASPILLWWAWASVLFAGVSFASEYLGSTPFPAFSDPVLWMAALFVASISGAIVAARYVISSFRLKPRTIMGVVALAANVGLIAWELDIYQRYL
jgi:hypothetical protein